MHKLIFTFVLDTFVLNKSTLLQLINFYRRKLHENICPSCSLGFPDKESTVRHMQETNHTNDVPALVQWDQPQFFFPTYENDHLLSLLEDVDDNPEVCVPNR